jgi:hypothetical protein
MQPKKSKKTRKMTAKDDEKLTDSLNTKSPTSSVKKFTVSKDKLKKVADAFSIKIGIKE